MQIKTLLRVRRLHPGAWQRTVNAGVTLTLTACITGWQDCKLCISSHLDPDVQEGIAPAKGEAEIVAGAQRHDCYLHIHVTSQAEVTKLAPDVYESGTPAKGAAEIIAGAQGHDCNLHMQVTGQGRGHRTSLLHMSRKALPQPKVRLRSLPVPRGMTATCTSSTLSHSGSRQSLGAVDKCQVSQTAASLSKLDAICIHCQHICSKWNEASGCQASCRCKFPCAGDSASAQSKA